MEIEQEIWGITPEGEAIIRYTMRNACGGEMRLTNAGAAVVGITVPDAQGRLADVALGYSHYGGYLGDAAMMGKIVGRVAGRIRNAVFPLDGEDVRLTRNAPPHHLNGGVDGFANRLWQSRVETDRVVFSLVSPDGDQGYPGELGMEVVYDWDDDNVLEITMFARCDKPTVVNLAPYIYINLAGESSGSVLGHELKVAAGSYVETDRGQAATGVLLPVDGTAVDFRTAKPLGRDIDGEMLRGTMGYDHCLVADGWQRGRLAAVAELYDPASGRLLRVDSTLPGLQVYTGNYLQGGPQGKSGREYADRDGVVLSPMGLAGAPNHPEFPSVRLDPDEVYEEHVVFRFGVR